ncbi:CPBP family intramembrane glutamic endopeptidase [Lacibacter sp. H407]|uniref:CPBP family intramembrane glutamic endopeptidase n=1 Tax=Lacibacter sp. H407 TaxID=3133423 RepID=UPI0030BC2035
MQTSPVVQKGWLRVLLFMIAFLLFIFFGNSILGLLIVLLGLNENNETLFYSSILLNFFIALVLVSTFRKVFDRRSFKSLGFTWDGFGNERAAGFLTGILLITVMATVLWSMGLLQWFFAEVQLPDLVLVTVIMMVVSIAEEMVFRGYILNNLMQSMPKQAALFTSALLFAGFHSLNPNFNLIAFINIFIAGVLLGCNYIYTRNLWFAIFFHFSWNFFQGPVLGFEVSGLELPTLLEQNIKGSILLTGGDFGLEASWLATFTMALMTLVLFNLFQRKYNGTVE